MKKNKLIVRTKSKTYPIYFGKNILKSTGKLIKKNLYNTKKICVISDNRIPKILFNTLVKSLRKYQLKIYKLHVSEKTKSLIVANKIIDQLLEENFNRSDCIVAFGGGIVGDLSSFIASITKRGLKFVNIPTTLLAQVDASIGGKTGINTAQGKNLIGTFHQPDFVLSDVSMLKSISQRELISGYGEILKHALILDRKFFFWLSKNSKNIIKLRKEKFLVEAIFKSCKIKNKIVSKDEEEKNLRMILNFGHTFAHGFERVKNFSYRLNHGEAVILGMMVASDLSNRKKILPLKELLLIKKHYISLKLFMNIKNFFKKNDVKKITHFMQKDKKNFDDKINLILLNKIGKTTKPKKVSLKVKEIKEFLHSYYN